MWIPNEDCCTSPWCGRLGGVQFLSDELSEVSKNRLLTVQFLRADFAAVSEVSGKSLCWILEIDILFMFVRTRWKIAVYRPVTQRFFHWVQKFITEKPDATNVSSQWWQFTDYTMPPWSISRHNGDSSQTTLSMQLSVDLLVCLGSHHKHRVHLQSVGIPLQQTQKLNTLNDA